MLVRPDIDDDLIVRHLGEAFGFAAACLAFLPLGADHEAAAFRVDARDGRAWFVKLRQRLPVDASLRIPRYLADCGIDAVLAPVPAMDGNLATRIASWHVVAYPFVEALPAAERSLSAAQWRTFGASLRRIHDTSLPADLAALVPRDAWAPRWRDGVRSHQRGRRAPDDPVSAGLSALLDTHAETIRRLVVAAEAGAEAMKARPREAVPCHADLHALNVLVGSGRRIHIVDWDELRFAPRERDLMFVGAGIIGVWNTPEESALFYEGYGDVAVDPAAIAYYRCERIVEDIAVTCDHVFGTTVDEANRRLAVAHLRDQFAPRIVVEIALAEL